MKCVHVLTKWSTLSVCVGTWRSSCKNLSLLHVSVSRLKRDMGSVSVTFSEKASSFFKQKMNALVRTLWTTRWSTPTNCFYYGIKRNTWFLHWSDFSFSGSHKPVCLYVGRCVCMCVRVWRGGGGGRFGAQVLIDVNGGVCLMKVKRLQSFLSHQSQHSCNKQEDVC